MKQKVIIVLLSCFIVLAFFYQLFQGKVPFPGDLLVNQEPYRSESIDGFVAGSIPNKAQGPDVIHELLPWKKFTIDSWKNLQIPFWDPYNFSGNPLMANYQSGVFYPGNIIFFILDFSDAWSIYIFLTPFLSILFTYLFLKRLKLSDAASLFGGLAFSFSLYMTVWMEYGNIGHTFLWLPLILYFTDRFVERNNRVAFLGIVLSSFAAALAGYIQGLFYIYAITFIYFLLKSNSLKKPNSRKIFIFISSLALPIFLTAFQMLPTLELFGESTRGNYSLDQIQKMLNPLYYLITIVAPDFFGNPASRNFWFDGTYIERVSYFGLIPFAFAILAIVSVFKRVEVKVFSILFIFSLLISTDLFITRFFYLIPIPVLSTTVATRILSVFAFSGAILAAFGFEQVLQSKDKKKMFMIFGLLLAVIIVAFVFTLAYPKTLSDLTVISQLATSKRNLIIPLATLIIFGGLTFVFYNLNLFKKYKKMIYVFVIFAITFAELFYYFQKITPFAPKNYMYPETPIMSFLQKDAGINRFWGYGTAYIESNFQTFDKTYSPEGNDPLHIKTYTELLSVSKDGKVPALLPRPDANIASGYGQEDLSNNSYRQKILNIVGIKYVLNRSEILTGDYSPDTVTFPEEKYKLAWQKGLWQAYENKNITQRIFITNKYKVVNEDKALQTLLNKDFNEKETLVLYEDPKIKQSDLKQSLKVDSYTPNKITISAKTSSDALLYVSDNYYPGWIASIDGQDNKIYLANYTFRAVVVPAGDHKVVFEFKPQSFYYGIYIALAGLAGLIIMLIIIDKKKNEK